jgi:hypothetical protein
MPQSIKANISVGWDIPSNITFKRQHNVLTINWDNITNINVSKIFWRVTSYVKKKEKIYDIAGNSSSKITIFPSTVIDIYDITEYKINLPHSVCSEMCIQIQAIYEINDSNGETYLAISEKTEPICVELPRDIYCENKKNVTKSVRPNISSKSRYAKAINSAKASSVFFGNYGRGFMSLGVSANSINTKL